MPVVLDGGSVLNPVFQDRRPRSPHFFFGLVVGAPRLRTPKPPSKTTVWRGQRCSDTTVRVHFFRCACKKFTFFVLSEFQTTKNRGLKKQHRDPKKNDEKQRPLTSKVARRNENPIRRDMCSVCGASSRSSLFFFELSEPFATKERKTFMIFGAHSLAPATPRQGTEKFDSSNLSLEWGKFRGNYSCVLPNFVRKFAAEIFPGQWGEEEEEREGGRLGRMRGGEGGADVGQNRSAVFRCGKFTDRIVYKVPLREKVLSDRIGCRIPLRKKSVENRKYPTIGRF